MTKTADDYFRDWVSQALGPHHGTRDARLVRDLAAFLVEVPTDGAYEYDRLVAAVGPLATWTLIDKLYRAGILAYVSSPRSAYLAEAGVALKRYVGSRPVDRLLETLAPVDDDYRYCMPDDCKCGPDGFHPDRACPSPFWPKHLSGEHVITGHTSQRR
jgi:hypothetical protein